MKFWHFFFAALVFHACTNAQVENSAPEPKTVSAPTLPPDSAPKPAATPTKNPNYIVLKTRPKAEMQLDYPYDIELLDAAGDTLRSDRVFATGKPTVLLFWLTTCIPCGYEMQAIQEKFADWQAQADFNFYAISTDFQKNYPAFQKRVREKQFPWQSFNDVHREFRRVMPGELNGLPQTFLLDAEGNVVYHKRKYRSGDEDALFAEILALSSN